jgi:hypothetical protein
MKATGFRERKARTKRPDEEATMMQPLVKCNFGNGAVCHSDPRDWSEENFSTLTLFTTRVENWRQWHY